MFNLSLFIMPSDILSLYSKTVNYNVTSRLFMFLGISVQLTHRHYLIKKSWNESWRFLVTRSQFIYKFVKGWLTSLWKLFVPYKYDYWSNSCRCHIFLKRVRLLSESGEYNITLMTGRSWSIISRSLIMEKEKDQTKLILVILIKHLGFAVRFYKEFT